MKSVFTPLDILSSDALFFDLTIIQRGKSVDKRLFAVGPRLESYESFNLINLLI